MDWLEPTLDLLSQPVSPRSTIEAREDKPRPLSSGVTLPQRGRKRKYLSSSGKDQRNEVVDIQKTLPDSETARADHNARKEE